MALEAAHQMGRPLAPSPHTLHDASQVPSDGAGHLELKCIFNNPDTETKVTPAGLEDRPPQPAAATEHVPDELNSQIAADLELDRFSAGNAAPQEQVCLLSAGPPWLLQRYFILPRLQHLLAPPGVTVEVFGLQHRHLLLMGAGRVHSVTPHRRQWPASTMAEGALMSRRQLEHLQNAGWQAALGPRGFMYCWATEHQLQYGEHTLSACRLKGLCSMRSRQLSRCQPSPLLRTASPEHQRQRCGSCELARAGGCPDAG